MSTTTLQSEKKKALIPQLRFPVFEREWEKIKLGDKIEIISGFAFKGDLFGDEGRKLVILCLHKEVLWKFYKFISTEERER